MTYTLFETIEDLLYYLRNGYSRIETSLDIEDQNVVNITISGKPIAQVYYRKATLEGEKDSMVAVSNGDLRVVERIEHRLDFLTAISRSNCVKDISITPTSIRFIYKNLYVVELLPRSIDNLTIKDLEASKIKFATLTHSSEVLETLDKLI